MYNDAYPTITTPGWCVGDTVNGFFNMCAFVPRSHADVVVCAEHGDTTPFYLNRPDTMAMLNTSVAALVFVCVCGAVLLVYGLVQCCRMLARMDPPHVPRLRIVIPLPEVRFERFAWWRRPSPAVASPAQVVVYVERPPPDYMSSEADAAADLGTPAGPAGRANPVAAAPSYGTLPGYDSAGGADGGASKDKRDGHSLGD
jgi:hypothetical protein